MYKTKSWKKMSITPINACSPKITQTGLISFDQRMLWMIFEKEEVFISKSANLTWILYKLIYGLLQIVC